MFGPESYNLLHNIILKDKMAIECLKTQENMMSKEILISGHIMKCCQKKAEIIKEKLELTEKQLLNFYEKRQEKINELSQKLAEIDNPQARANAKIARWKKERIELEELLHKLLKNIEYIEKNIPEQAQATVYTAKPK